MPPQGASRDAGATGGDRTQAGMLAVITGRRPFKPNTRESINT